MHDSIFVCYAKMVIIMLLCMIYLPFGVTDLYLGITSQESCIMNENEFSMKDYLILSGYSELVLLVVSIFIIISPSNFINDKYIKVYYIIYSGMNTIYMILNLIGIYIYMMYVFNRCIGLSEYIFMSLSCKNIFTIIILYMMCN
jgi:multisubunit Na+/H+ antiporter MnhB subunit